MSGYAIASTNYVIAYLLGFRDSASRARMSKGPIRLSGGGTWLFTRCVARSNRLTSSICWGLLPPSASKEPDRTPIPEGVTYAAVQLANDPDGETHSPGWSVSPSSFIFSRTASSFLLRYFAIFGTVLSSSVRFLISLSDHGVRRFESMVANVYLAY
jgi:hypothetical protein